MKKWNAPKVEDLDVKMTESGSDESTFEHNGGFLNGVWTASSYDAVNYEKCKNPDGSFQGSITPKKQSTES